MAARYGIGIHLSLCILFFFWLMPSGTTSMVLDQLTETFEYIFSPLPFFNSKMVLDVAIEGILSNIIILLLITAIPAYPIGYALFVRSLKQRQRYLHIFFLLVIAHAAENAIAGIIIL